MFEIPGPLGTLVNFFIIAIGFGSIIFVHELGHFLAAKWAGIRVLAFSIGFGQVACSYRKGMGFQAGSSEPAYQKLLRDNNGDHTKLNISPTEYRLSWLPLGGYVKMLGQEDLNPVATSTAKDSYQNCPIPKRLVVISAGVVVNVITAALLFIVVFSAGLNIMPPSVGQVLPSSPASLAAPVDPQYAIGLQPGDTVLSVNNKPVRAFRDIATEAAMSSSSRPASIIITREGIDQPIEYSANLKPGAQLGLLDLGITPLRSTELILTDDMNLWNQRADDYGLAQIPPGSTITAINNQPVETTVDIQRIAMDHNRPAHQLHHPRRRLQRTQHQRTTRTHDPTRRDRRHPPPNRAHPRPHRSHARPPRCLRIRNKTRTHARRYLHQHRRRPIPLPRCRHQSHPRPHRKPNRYPGSSEPTTKPEPSAPSNSKSKSPTTDESVSTPTPPPTHPQSSPCPLLSPINSPPPSPLAQRSVPSQESQSRPLDQAAQVIVQSNTNTVPVTFSTIENPEPQEATITLTDQQLLSLANLHKRWPGGPDMSTLFLPVQTIDKASGPIDAVARGFHESRRVMLQTYLTFLRLTQGTVKVEHLKGPVGIAHIGTMIADEGFIKVLFFMGLISINLAVINFLPLPIVDGGQFLFLIYEWIRGKPIPIPVQNAVTMAGLLLIGSMFLLVTFNDIKSLVGF